MTIKEKDELINQMTKEDPDSTIRDYMDLMNELKGITEVTSTLFMQRLEARYTQIRKQREMVQFKEL
jgi:hypothetical protein